MCFERFLLAFESHDLSQADKRITRVSSFPSFNFWMINYSCTQKSYLALWQTCFGQFITQKFPSLKSKQFSQFFWWEVNLRGLRRLILQQPKEMCQTTCRGPQSIDDKIFGSNLGCYFAKRLDFKKYSLLTLFNANFELNNQDKNGPFPWN